MHAHHLGGRQARGQGGDAGDLLERLRERPFRTLLEARRPRPQRRSLRDHADEREDLRDVVEAGDRVAGLDPSLFLAGKPVLLDLAGILPPDLGATRAEPVDGLPGAVLVRPDGYAAWAADTDPDLDALVGNPCWSLLR
ncbi:hypothetical protein [Nonomuraea angiospora]|uniref:hypothetical protein n=1 Tax=Nonomuraea angiospora TaxID=46172 RepID=UPI0029A3EB5B|nr:hypothetical protein [Nonomuraea angiospora]MDX3107484.1 hypothetical protein [Nonomuraea angiospora]